MSEQRPQIPSCTGAVLRRDDGSFYFLPMDKCGCAACRFYWAMLEAEAAQARARLAYAEWEELMAREPGDE